MRENSFVKAHSIFELMAQTGHEISELAAAFPGKNVGEIEEIFHDNRLSLRRTYERFGYLGIRECISKNFNIDRDGARSNGTVREVSQETHRVHCYGGSTTVGDGVSDSQTISSYLEIALNKATTRKRGNFVVFNFGAGNHTSLHSSLRLLDHCLAGNVPQVAVFLNGFNDCYYSAGGADGIAPFLNEVLFQSQDTELRHNQLLQIVSLIPSYFSETSEATELVLDSDLLSACSLAVKSRYSSAVAIQSFVKKYYGVKILRFIEPNHAVSCRNDQKLLPRFYSLNQRRKMVELLYRRIQETGIKDFFGQKAISLLSIDQDRKAFPLFLDGVHFTPAMNELIANQMVGPINSSVSNRRIRLQGSVERKSSVVELSNPDNYPLF